MNENELYSILDDIRASGKEGNVLEVLTLADEKRVSYSIDNVIELFSRQRHSGHLVYPKSVTSFLYEFIRTSGCKRLFDPFAGAGLLLGFIGGAKNLESVTGLCLSSDEYKIATKLFSDLKFNWIHARLEGWSDFNTYEFDSIVSCPPWGSGRIKTTLCYQGNEIEIADEQGRVLLLQSALRLPKDGVAAFIVTPNFFFLEGKQTANVLLSKFGLHVNAAISIPQGSFSPYTAIEAYIVFISRRRDEKLFIGQLSNNVDRNKGLLSNLRAGSESKKDPAMGRLVCRDSFKGFGAYVAHEQWNNYLVAQNLTGKALSEFCSEVNVSRKDAPYFEDKDNVVYLPVIRTTPAVTSLNDLQVQPQNYLQLVLDSSVVSADYLALFLNSGRGKALRNSLSSGTTIPRLSKKSLADGVFALPSLEVQLGVVDAQTKIGALQAELAELRTTLLDSPMQLTEVLESLEGRFKTDDFENWLSSLPFPLASILWVYHARKSDPEGKARQLLHFFEALSCFYAVVFLSGVHTAEDMFKKYKEKLGSVLPPEGLKEATVGKWNRIVELAVSEINKIEDPSKFKDQQDQFKQMFRISEFDSLRYLFTKETIEVLQDANSRRNEWQGHGGLSNTSEWRRRLQHLEGLLIRYRASVGRSWSSYRMIRPGACEFSDGVFNYHVQMLMGDRMIFKTELMDLSSPLDTKKLYLVDKNSRSALELLPFVKVLASPSSEENACYFYNRVTNDGVKVVSYHFETASEQTDEFSDILSVLSEFS